MSEEQTPSEGPERGVLWRAAQVLRSSGWCRYELGPDQCDAGPHCALGAINCVVDKDSQEAEYARRKLSVYLMEAKGAEWAASAARVITNWNDQKAWSREDVIRAMEDADAAA